MPNEAFTYDLLRFTDDACYLRSDNGSETLQTYLHYEPDAPEVPCINPEPGSDIRNSLLYGVYLTVATHVDHVDMRPLHRAYEARRHPSLPPASPVGNFDIRFNPESLPLKEQANIARALGGISTGHVRLGAEHRLQIGATTAALYRALLAS